MHTHLTATQNMSGTKKEQNTFIKNCVFILTRLNFSQLQSTLHLMHYTYQHIFSTAQDSFWTWFWWLLVLLPFFVSLLPRQQNISLWGPFSSRENNKKVTQDKIRWIGRVGHGSHVVFHQKLLNTQSGVERWACKLLIMKFTKVLKRSSKKMHEAEHSLSQQCQLVHWYRWVPRTLT